jgi:hypothetical protein
LSGSSTTVVTSEAGHSGRRGPTGCIPSALWYRPSGRCSGRTTLCPNWEELGRISLSVLHPTHRVTVSFIRCLLLIHDPAQCEVRWRASLAPSGGVPGFAPVAGSCALGTEWPGHRARPLSRPVFSGPVLSGWCREPEPTSRDDRADHGPDRVSRTRRRPGRGGRRSWPPGRRRERWPPGPARR